MPDRSQTISFDTLGTTTLSNYQTVMRDQIFDDYPLLSYVNGKLGRTLNVRGKIKRGTVKKTQAGGIDIIEPLLYGKNSTAQSVGEYETFDVTPQEGVTNARFPWKLAYVTITVSGTQERANRGKEKIISLAKTKIMQAENSLRDALSLMLWSDGTGNSSKDIDGLALLVSDTTTCGGLAPATHPTWVSTITASGSFASQGRKDMRTMYGNLSKGQVRPDIAFTTRTILDFYEESLSERMRFQSNKVADDGFDNLLFKGVPIVPDNDCPSGEMTWLNSAAISYVVDPDADFSTSPFRQPIDQDAKTAVILLQANMTINERRRCGRLTGITE